MGLLVALLSLINISLGYGLAVYLRRASPPVLPSRPVAPQPIVSPATQPKSALNELPPTEKPKAATEEVVAETEITEDTKPPVDEENVLAGIEAFRAQLAQVKDESEAEVEAIDEEAVAGK